MQEPSPGNTENGRICLRDLSKATRRKSNFSCKKKEKIKPKKQASEFARHGSAEPFHVGANSLK